MTARRAGRPMAALRQDLPPALRSFAVELRRRRAESGLTLRDLARAIELSPASLSRVFNGERLMSEADLRRLASSLGLAEDETRALELGLRQARAESEGATGGQGTGGSDLRDHLLVLREESGLSLREIAQRLEAAGTPLGKSTIERALRDPAPALPHSLEVAEALIGALPDAEREAATQGVLQAARAAVTPPAVQGEAPYGARPISQWDPLDLGVHRAVRPASTAVGQALPGYVLRAHDRALARVVSAAAEGTSGMAVLVGSSSTGKTRACWEAVRPLAPKGWRLWHPVDPTRADAALRGLDEVRPRTVVWLNETQHYLGQPRHGERLAAALHDLLVRPERGPVLVLGTLWPEHAHPYTAPPAPGAPDPHPRARDLLAGRLVAVPDAFDQDALRSAGALARHGDAPLAEALAWSSGGRVPQFLAGGPELLRRYAASTPAARALLDAAIDARRYGAGAALPRSFLTEAAVGYLSDSEYDSLSGDWARGALAEATAPVHGRMAPLRPGPERERRDARDSPTARAFRLAEYLVQFGRASRRTRFPPSSFWYAAYAHLPARDLFALSTAAFRSARLTWANQLVRRAADLGGPVVEGTAVLYSKAALAERSGDHDGAEQLYQQAAEARDPLALFRLAQAYERAGDAEGVERLARSAADAEGFLPLTDTGPRAGEGAEPLYRRAAEAGDPHALFRLFRMRERGGDPEGAERVALKAADAGYAWLFNFPVRWPDGLDADGTITPPPPRSDD
ncbi:helix-turn-helix domain-containing protein [Streptomyces sp. YIM 121038]|uniref:helix-turn-helix domain-containing protein n=1 Tax=Streptomyces sp. YIM 121038 TaxID=2136401 RepID=UPI001110D64B|nr:helix-turn-helix domain-containing protein [Streptomyces sp. YIM 121038]